jgi:hypothetical protein
MNKSWEEGESVQYPWFHTLPNRFKLARYRNVDIGNKCSASNSYIITNYHDSASSLYMKTSRNVITKYLIIVTLRDNLLELICDQESHK